MTDKIHKQLAQLSSELGATLPANIVFVMLVATRDPAEPGRYLTTMLANAEPVEFSELIRDWLRRFDAGEFPDLNEEAQGHA